jgi:hypothetical protein
MEIGEKEEGKGGSNEDRYLRRPPSENVCSMSVYYLVLKTDIMIVNYSHQMAYTYYNRNTVTHGHQ